MPYSGSGGIWATRAGDFVATNFPGTQAGFQAAADWIGALSGAITVLPGLEALAAPTLGAKTALFWNRNGRFESYGPLGVAAAMDLLARQSVRHYPPTAFLPILSDNNVSFNVASCVLTAGSLVISKTGTTPFSAVRRGMLAEATGMSEAVKVLSINAAQDQVTVSEPTVTSGTRTVTFRAPISPSGSILQPPWARYGVDPGVGRYFYAGEGFGSDVSLNILQYRRRRMFVAAELYGGAGAANHHDTYILIGFGPYTGAAPLGSAPVLGEAYLHLRGRYQSPPGTPQATSLNTWLLAYSAGDGAAETVIDLLATPPVTAGLPKPEESDLEIMPVRVALEYLYGVPNCTIRAYVAGKLARDLALPVAQAPVDPTLNPNGFQAGPLIGGWLGSAAGGLECNFGSVWMGALEA